jgi:hypothetical protein
MVACALDWIRYTSASAWIKHACALYSGLPSLHGNYFHLPAVTSLISERCSESWICLYAGTSFESLIHFSIVLSKIKLCSVIPFLCRSLLYWLFSVMLCSGRARFFTVISLLAGSHHWVMPELTIISQPQYLEKSVLRSLSYEGLFPQSECNCDHSSLMESHWHRALFLVARQLLSIGELKMGWKYVLKSW